MHFAVCSGIPAYSILLSNEPDANDKMSGWGLGWFGGGSAQAKKNAPKNAILNLRSQLDMLQKRERHLQTQIDEAEAKAKKFLAKDRKSK